MKLYELVDKIYNRSTYGVVGNMIVNLMESLHNTMLIREDDSYSLPKCPQVTEYRHEMLKKAGFDVANLVL